jgi:hypothetical protein
MNEYDDIFTSENKSENVAAVTGKSDFDKASWAEQKQQEREHAYKLIESTAEKLTQDGLFFKGFLDVLSKFDRYSVANNLLILAQKPEATKLADFKSWKENDVFIKKGAMGVIILEPGDEYPREDGTVGVSYNTKKLFDISQTSSKIAPTPKVRRDDRLLIKALINNATVEIKIEDQLEDGINAIYKPETKEILIRKGLDGDDIFKALAQEVAHAEMDKGNYNRCECIFPAYCVSYILCKRSGYDVSNFSFDQLPEAYRGMAAMEIRSELSKIRETANNISSDMARLLDPNKGQTRNNDNNVR